MGQQRLSGRGCGALCWVWTGALHSSSSLGSAPTAVAALSQRQLEAPGVGKTQQEGAEAELSKVSMPAVPRRAEQP